MLSEEQLKMIETAGDETLIAYGRDLIAEVRRLRDLALELLPEGSDYCNCEECSGRRHISRQEILGITAEGKPC